MRPPPLPAPLMVNGIEPIETPFCSSRAAPDATVTIDAWFGMLPNAALLSRISVPSLTAMGPVRLLAFCSVTLCEPFKVRPVVPEMEPLPLITYCVELFWNVTPLGLTVPLTVTVWGELNVWLLTALVSPKIT